MSWECSGWRVLEVLMVFLLHTIVFESGRTFLLREISLLAFLNGRDGSCTCVDTWFGSYGEVLTRVYVLAPLAGVKDVRQKVSQHALTVLPIPDFLPSLG